MSKSASRMSQSEWIQFLVDEVPKFDEMIMAEIRPKDGWFGRITYPWTPRIPEWFACRESVRKISEGDAFKPSRSPKPEPMGHPVEITQDRFRAVWHNTTKDWKRRLS